MRMKLQWLCTLTLALCCGTAWADGRPDLKVQIGVEREVTVVDAEGKKQVMLEPVEKAKAGDVLVYTLRYHNVGEAPAAGAVLSDPVPEGTVLIRSSVAGDNAEITFSTDGETYSPWPQQERRAADGKLVWRFRAAQADRRVIAYGQLESLWPVRGSVLVEDGAALFAAGRSSSTRATGVALALSVTTTVRLSCAEALSCSELSVTVRTTS